MSDFPPTFTIPLGSFFRKYVPTQDEEPAGAARPLPQNLKLAIEELIAEGSAGELDWESEVVQLELIAELPFWLLVEDGTLTVEHDGASVRVDVRRGYSEVLYGAFASRNRSNLLGVYDRERAETDMLPLLPEVRRTRTCFRHLKTVLVMHAWAAADALEALSVEGELRMMDPRLRRRNGADHYFKTLAFGHLPIINKLISAYRHAAPDPFAHEISEWDVPSMFLRTAAGQGVVMLSPYRTMDHYPAPASFPDPSRPTIRKPVVFTTCQKMQDTLSEPERPGLGEMLDAWNSMYVGRFGDAIRHAVTAVEVALDAAVGRAARARGMTEGQVEEELRRTYNDFSGRLEQLSTLRRRRVPGPILHGVPYINGIRLQAEINETRDRRHKVVHEGLRIAREMTGTARRCVETSNLLLDWINADIGGGRWNPNIALTESLRADFLYSTPAVEGRRIVVRPHLPAVIELAGTADVPTAENLRRRQWEDAAGGTEAGADVELFAAMWFSECEAIEAEDAPPAPDGGDLPHPRYVLAVDNSPGHAVFLLNRSSGLNAADLAAVAAGQRAWELAGGCSGTPLVFANVFCDVPWGIRSSGRGVQEHNGLAASLGLSLISVHDLIALATVSGNVPWRGRNLLEMMLDTGGGFEEPPGGTRVGEVRRYYEGPGALSLTIDENAHLERGSLIAIRGRFGYTVLTVQELQVNRVSIDRSGAGRVGIKHEMSPDEVVPGEPVWTFPHAAAELDGVGARGYGGSTTPPTAGGTAPAGHVGQE